MTPAIRDLFECMKGSSRCVFQLLPARYHVFISEESIYPDYSHRYFGTKWTNGRKFYVDDDVSVSQLKRQIYEAEAAPPAGVKVGCRGRVFEDTDNLAMAVRAFCRRDPRILLFKDDM